MNRRHFPQRENGLPASVRVVKETEKGREYTFFLENFSNRTHQLNMLTRHDKIKNFPWIIKVVVKAVPISSNSSHYLLSSVYRETRTSFATLFQIFFLMIRKSSLKYLRIGSQPSLHSGRRRRICDGTARGRDSSPDKDQRSTFLSSLLS